MVFLNNAHHVDKLTINLTAREQGDSTGHLQAELPGPPHLRGLVQEVGRAHREDLQQDPEAEVCLGH